MKEDLLIQWTTKNKWYPYFSHKMTRRQLRQLLQGGVRRLNAVS